MAEGRGLTSAPEAPAAAPLGEDHAPATGAIHAALAAILVVGSFALPAVGQSSTAWHSGAEMAAIILAATLGGLGLVRYYSRRQRAFLYIGTGFLAAAALDAVHLLLASGVWTPRDFELAAQVDVSAWSWIQGRTFLALFLAVSVLAPRLAPAESHRPGRGGERSVYLVAAVLTAVVVAFFTLAPLAPAIRPDAWLARPAELLPAVLFGLAYAGYYRRGRWRTDPFEHWLLLSLLVAAALHALYMSRSAQLGDPYFDAAHLLKVASYGTVLVGLMVSTFQTFQREGRVLDAITRSNEALEHEVTVRRQAETVLQRSEERLQNFLDNAHDLILSTAPDGRVLYVNAAWTRTLGYTEQDLEGLRLPDLLHPECRERVMAAFRHVLAGEDVRRLTAEFVSRDGRVVVCSGSATRHTEDGVPVSTQAIFRDVTEQRRAERELAASRANLAALVENTGDAIWSVDTRQRLVTFNSAFALAVEARSGREPRVGDPPEAVFGQGQARWYRDLYDRVLGGERFSALLEERLEGQQRVVEIFCNPVLEAQGTTGAVMFGKDVTRRLQAEEALRVAKEDAELANRAKSQFLANMSHELRTPLNSVIGFANILLKNKKENLTKQDTGFLDRILANGRHLLALINEVLDLAKIEAGRMELELRTTDLRELAQETVDQLEGQAREKRVTLVAEVPEGAAEIETDPPKLKQVIINLVGNAMKFTEGGRVTVRVELGLDGRTPEAIAVEDTGIGIPQDRLEAIFEAFQQADGGTARKYGGTGLGLTISRSICNMLGYELTVTSEVGRGSTFTIHLIKDEVEVVPLPPVQTAGASRPDDEAGDDDGAAPAGPHEGGDDEASVDGAAAAPEPGPEPDPDPEPADQENDEIVGLDTTDGGSEVLEAPPFPQRRGERDFLVLVIDDETDSRVLMTHYLHDLGCRVVQASSASEGLALARERRPDLITLDLMMPGMSGWELLRTLKQDEDLRRTPVVVVSIVAAEGRGRLLGAVDLLTKPVDREDLVRVLWRNLVRHGPARVLVVEDDADVRVTVSEYLKDAGLEVRAVANGKEALKAVDAEAPDAVVLDLKMPVMDGFTFLDKLRETPYHQGLPVVVLTGRDLTTDDRRRLGETASSVVEKGAEVEARLREVLGTFLPIGG